MCQSNLEIESVFVCVLRKQTLDKMPLTSGQLESLLFHALSSQSSSWPVVPTGELCTRTLARPNY